MNGGSDMAEEVTRYAGREQTQLANADGVGALVARTALEYELAGGADKVPLNDIAAIRRTATEYLQSCADAGVLPTVRGVASRLGDSRAGLYDHAKKRPGGAFDEWLQDFSDCCAEATMQAAMTGNVKEVSAIFTTKARFGWKELPTQIELGPLNGNPSFSEDAELIAAKYAELPSD